MQPTEAPLVSLPSEAGTWQVTIWTAPQPPRQGTVAAKFRLVDQMGAGADGLTLEVVPWMPAHGHGTSVVPAVTSEGEGWYLVTPLLLYMPGRWELRTTVTGAGGVAGDSVVPAVDVP